MAWIVLYEDDPGHYEDALEAWQARDQPGADDLIEVLAWLLALVESGPPDDHLPVPLTEDLYISRVTNTDIFVTYPPSARSAGSPSAASAEPLRRPIACSAGAGAGPAPAGQPTPHRGERRCFDATQWRRHALSRGRTDDVAVGLQPGFPLGFPSLTSPFTRIAVRPAATWITECLS